MNDRPASALESQFLRFGMVGTVGFVTDAGLTLAFHRMLGLGDVWPRILGFLCAATVTWWLNRQFTFRSEGGASSWLAYVVATSAGAAINIACYAVVLHVLGTGAWHLVIGVAVGSIAAMGFNFWVSRRWVFAKASAQHRG